MTTSATRSTSFEHVRLLALGASLALFGACGGADPPPPEYPHPPPLPDPPATEDPVSRDLAEVQSWNEAVRAETVDTLHGQRVSDPYRSLEEDSPSTRDWITKQSARSRRYLEAHTRPGIAERLGRLLSIGVIGSTSVAGNRVYYTKREGQREQPVLMVAERRRGPAERSGGLELGPPRELIDPTSFGERSALDWYFPSPDGRYVAFGISRNGDERSTLHVVEVESGQQLPVAIENTKWCQLSWLSDSSGFYYTRYPRTGEEGFDAEEPDTYWPRVRFHVLAAPAGQSADEHARGSGDPIVYSGRARTDFPEPNVSSDGRWLVINNFRGWTKQEVFVIDRQRPVPSGGVPEALGVLVDHDSLSTGIVHRGRLWVATNRDAPKYRILTANVRDLRRAAEAPLATGAAGAWTLVVPETENPIEGWQLGADRLVVHYLENIQSSLRVFQLDGRRVGDIPLPQIGSVDSLDTNADTPLLSMVFSSFFYPPTLLALRLEGAGAAGLNAVQVDQVQTDFDTSAYVLSRESVPSRDGTPINVFFMHRRDLQRNGRNPVLLTGYGGFNVSLTPGYARSPLYWLERGGVYASANLRGGAEFGEGWHRAGALGNKERVFEDFEAVIRWFSSSGISSPDHIGITGGSNGGLLMGAMLTRCPDAFRATATYVGLYDMVRYHRFPPAELWISEYGSSESAEQLRWLLAYSPYHRVRDGVRYPATWIETADHDTRVFWGHSTKFAARLQDAQTGPHPIYFYREENVGHGAGTQRSDLILRYTRMYTFLEDQLGVPPAATPPAAP